MNKMGGKGRTGGWGRTDAISCVLLSALALLPGCQGSSGTARPVPRSPITYTKDIAPILFAHCGSCHRPGEAAPFSLLDYRDVRSHARQIATVTKNRVMPPWLPEHGYGEFIGERRLRDDQIDTIQQWVAQGAVEGDPSAKPAEPKWREGWQIGEPDLVLRMPEPYTLQAGGPDVFRNFVIPVPLAASRYVRAMELRPGNAKILHHASVGVDRTRFSRKLDRADPGPGFASMPEDEVQNIFGWSPGRAPFLEPADLAWPLEKGSDLVVQLHLLPSGKPEVIQPTLGLFFTDKPPTHVPLVIKLESKSIDIPAGKADYAIEDSYVLPVDVDVLSVYPHAHYLGREVKGFATLPDGSRRWLIWIRTWSFTWQDQYRYATPVFLPKGTTVTMRFTYDNSDGNLRNPHHPAARVRWGPLSTDEMGALWLEILPRRREDAAILLHQYAERSLRADIAGAQMQVRTSPEDPLAHNFLATKYLQAGRVPEAMAELEQTLQLKPDDAEAHSNLGNALLLVGRGADATQHVREAARLKPDDDRVHFNLGNALNASGLVDEAIREFRRAIQLNAENADAHFNLALVLASHNRLGEAAAHFRRVFDINPQNDEAHRNLGLALALEGKLDEGIAEVREALRIRPDSAEAHKTLASLLQAKQSSSSQNSPPQNSPPQNSPAQNSPPQNSPAQNSPPQRTRRTRR